MTEPGTVLIIDDSDDEILLTERILLRIVPGIRVESALSGEEGLAWLRRCRTLPLLTLLDLKMTGIDGIETLRRIRADERLKDLAVAVMTNSDLQADYEKTREAGADAIIHKAADLDLFSEYIRNELEKRTGQRPPGPDGVPA